MTEASQRFGRLAAQFEMIEHDLSACQGPEQRRNLLRGMMILLDQIDDVLTDFVVDLKRYSTARTDPPLSKAAHQ